MIKKKILIVFGDPNSINSEIIYKTWRKLNNSLKKRICIIGNLDLIKKQFAILGYNLKLKKIERINDKIDNKKLNIININFKFKKPFKVSEKDSSKFVRNSLNLAHLLSKRKIIDGFINCPINKKILPRQAGVTDYLASKCNIKNGSEVMLIKNKNLSVVPITTHINISKVAKKIKSYLIKKKIFTLNNWFKKNYKRKPKIAILGLNPHNAEIRKNSEEFRIINPSIIYLKKKGIKISGPFVADTIFIKEYKNFDVIVGMYHDQVLSSLKSIYNFDAINITLGLPFLRISPDHGPNYEMIGKNISNPNSLVSAIKFLDSI